MNTSSSLSFKELPAKVPAVSVNVYMVSVDWGYGERTPASVHLFLREALNSVQSLLDKYPSMITEALAVVITSWELDAVGHIQRVVALERGVAE